MKGVLLKNCRVKHRDPTEKMSDKQFMLLDDKGTISEINSMHLCMYVQNIHVSTIMYVFQCVQVITLDSQPKIHPRPTSGWKV